MKIKFISILTALVLFLSLCACSASNPNILEPEESEESEEVITVVVSQPENSDKSKSNSQQEKPKSSANSSKSSRALETLKRGTSTWQEVSIKKDNRIVSSSRAPFDLRSIITGQDHTITDYYFNTYVFRGTIVGMKEYQVSWVDENDEKWGPFSQTILDVRINKEYHGKNPVKGNTIKVIYPSSTSRVSEGSVYIKENFEYVFANSWVLDEKYVNYVAKYNPHNKFEPEKYADITIGGAWSSIFLIDNGKVMMYHEYFDYDKETMKKTLSPDSVKTNMLTTADALKDGDFIAMNLTDFEKAFSTLFENPDKLPTAKE